MTKGNFILAVIYHFVLFSILTPSNSSAYIGPGAGLSALGSLLAIAATIVIALFGFVWFPIKRLVKNFRQK